MSPVKSKSSAIQAPAAPGQSISPAQAPSGDPDELSPVLVIGSSGNVGRLFTQAMTESGLSVRGLDRSASGEAGFLTGDVTALTPEISQLIESSATLLVCLPEEPALAACGAIIERMREGALWVDTLSVKSAICSCLSKESGKKIEAVSINPMFAPSCGFSGQNVAAVTVHPGSRSERCLAWLESTGATVTALSAEEHDRATEAIQVITHAAILAFGAALKSIGYEVDTAWRLSTPVHRAMMAMLARMVLANPGPYWDVQSKHPQASSARALLIENIAGLEKMVCDGQASSFERLFLDLREMFSNREPELRELCSKLLKS
jgi:prephenate dehydrogenase